jgi:hypothetical protein
MPLASQFGVSLVATLTQALDLATAQVPLQVARSYQLADGAGADQANRIFHDQRTLAASANEDLDLAGVLLDPFGAAITFARVKALLVAPAAANTNNVVVGAAATNPFLSWVGAGTHTVTVRPGGVLLLAAPDATAYAVTAGTGDLLRIANSGAGTSVTYDIVVIGAAT